MSRSIVRGVAPAVCAASAARLSRTCFFSPGDSHFASAGLSSSSSQISAPSSTAGSPCSRNSHCQPCQPLTPWKYFSIAPHSGPVMTLTIVVADMKVAITWPRRTDGYQYVKYRMMPGKKPASNTPSRKRAT